jgi:soluble lytic murein transglycosylase-like protein
MSEEQPNTHPVPLGLRAAGRERRASTDRRHGRRFAWDRRRGERRKQQLRTLLFAAATLATPSQILKLYPMHPSVSVSIDQFKAIRPDRAYDALIAEAAQRYELDPALIKAVMRTESAFDPLAVSPVGAQGLMQLMPALAEEMGVKNAFDPRENIMGGAKYLRKLLDSTRGNLSLTLASYNAGPGNVARYRGIPPFKETRNYVKKITALLATEDTQKTTQHAD